MAPAMSLARAGTSRLTTSRPAQRQRTIVHASASENRTNIALASLAAGALLAQSALVDPATAAQVATPAPTEVVASSNKFAAPARAAPELVFGELADQNADVRDAATNYRDPAGAVQLDKFNDAVKGGDTPDLGRAADKAASKAKQAIKGNSAVPSSIGDLAAGGVRSASAGYRDPAGAAQQDRFSDAVSEKPDVGAAAKGKLSKLGEKAKDVLTPNDKAKRLLEGKTTSALPTSAIGELADANADIRDTASGYRDPAIATPQDNASGAVKGNIDTPDLGRAADKAASKAKGVLKGNSALPTSAIGELADQNADVRNDSTDYRDPAIAVPQDKATGAVKGNIDTPDLGRAADKAASKAKSVLKGNSALPTSAIGELADLNGDIRGAAFNYRDPLFAGPQSKAKSAISSGTNALPGSGGAPDFSAAGDKLSDAFDSAGAKAKRAIRGNSALPTSAIGELADLNRDVRGDADNYRDPAGAVQLDKFNENVKGNLPSLGNPLSGKGKDLSNSAENFKQQARNWIGSKPFKTGKRI